MDLTCSLGHICLIIFAFTYSSNCQFHTTGYAYQLISGLDRDSSLSPELMHVYHNCWIDNVCKYVAKVKRTGKYVSLNSLEEGENIKYSGIWKKRVEGMKLFNIVFGFSSGDTQDTCTMVNYHIDRTSFSC